MGKDNIVVEQNEMKTNGIRILKGSIFAIIISAILLIIFALLLCYANLKEVTMKPVIFTITGISILIGSMTSTKSIKKNGIINGGIVGLIYILILYIISSLFVSGFSITLNSIFMLAIGTITGIIGGIIGVNINKK